jgi:hypothetical protein
MGPAGDKEHKSQDGIPHVDTPLATYAASVLISLRRYGPALCPIIRFAGWIAVLRLSLALQPPFLSIRRDDTPYANHYYYGDKQIREPI